MHPCVVRQDGWLFLLDGHHRAVNAMLRGETAFRAYVARPDAKGQLR